MNCLKINTKKTTAIDISKIVIQKNTEMKKTIDNMKLQILLFYIQKNSIKKRKKKLFKENVIKGGIIPIVKNVFNKYLKHKNMIKEDEIKYVLNKEDEEIIDEIIIKYKDTDTIDIIDKINKEIQKIKYGEKIF